MKRPILLIEWEDSYNGDHTWSRESELPRKVKGNYLRTVGYLMRRSKKRVTLAMSLQKGDADPQFCDLFTIPTGCIISEKVLGS